MISEIYIRDLGVIREARLEFGPGLTVLTGETGAGKTMVLSALGLLLGERADSSAVRHDAESAFVEGQWMIADPEIAARLDEAGTGIEEGALILNRSVNSEGRSKASAGGRSVPVGLLAELGEKLVVVHGQSDQVRLRSATAQREALDQFAGVELATIFGEYSNHFRAWRATQQELRELTANQANRERELSELRATAAELTQLDAKPGELEELNERIERLSNIEGLRLAATTAHDLISSESFDSQDAISLLGQARRALEQQSGSDSKLEDLSSTLRDLGSQLTDVAAALSGYVSALESEGPGSLESLQNRKAQISSLCRKYSVDFEELIQLRITSQNRLDALDLSPEDLEELELREARLAEVVTGLAQRISRLRETAARLLEQAVSAELQALAMPGAKLVVEITPTADLTAHGADQITMKLSAFPGAEPRPLGKGASGGELSRIMLAIEVVLATTTVTPTFIFDEVDAGVGGASAIEIGRRLARLAKQAQVVVVTHLAQVAAFANTHLQVTKSVSSEVTVSDVVKLSQEQRVTELARMLSGLEDSSTGREHAAELLSIAQQEFAR